MASSLEESPEPVSAPASPGGASATVSRRDTRDTALLLAGLVLLILSLLGAWLQRPTNSVNKSRMSWLMEPRETNAFLKLPSTVTQRGIHFDGPRIGWTVGDNGTILHTADGGQSWQQQTSGTQNYLFSVYGSGDGKTLWAVGGDGTILHAADGGQSWQQQTSGTQNYLKSVYGSGDGKTLWAVGDNGTIVHTTDGGQSWRPQASGERVKRMPFTSTRQSASSMRIPCADLRLEIKRATAHHGASPHESRFDRHLVPSRLDLEAESERSFCPLEPRRQVPGGFVDESLDSRCRRSDSPPAFPAAGSLS